MADAALEQLLEKLQQLLLYKAQLVKGVKTQMEKLEMNLRVFRAFLADSAQLVKDDDDAVFEELVRQASDVIYEVEDVVDSFVSWAANYRSSQKYIIKAVGKRVELFKFSKLVDEVSAKVANITNSNIGKMYFASLDPKEQQHKQNFKEQGVSLVREDNIVGFEDEVDALFGYLLEDTEELDVITIVGMPGIGKTTLAWMVYRNERIQYEFPTCIWIHVSNNLTDKDIFVAILRHFTRVDESGRGVEELGQLVIEHLKRGRFLIVMDDVRSVDEWDRFRIALPKSNQRGKVLVTTCNEEVGRHANRLRPPYKLRFLSQSESWSLLQLEVFGRQGNCPQELENIGKLIANQCEGLPLALLVMAGILTEKMKYLSSSDTSAMKTAWIKACQDVPRYRSKKFYDYLPKHLRVCFLYFGMFPPGFEIPVWKLIQMWIAEGFIRKQDGVSLEETGENYLKDLINRHLVEVDQIRFGKVKTCRIHPMLHEFCKIQAGKDKENVLQEIRKVDGVFEPPISQLPLYRRLCIHSNLADFLSSKPFGPAGVRSLVSFFIEDFNLPPESNSAIPRAFKLLRVLDVKPIIFSKIHNGMYQLVHLKYLVLSFTLSVLPTGFSKLSNIHTLIVYTTSRTLEIKADVWKLAQLRHFKINSIANLPKASRTKQEGQNLQTLGTISPNSCTEENFDMAPNLKKLGIRGRLYLLVNGKEGSFDCLGRLASLEKLKLLNDVFPLPPSEGRVQSLPPAYKFPPRLRSLTLSDTLLDWSQMLILGLLEKLEVLKLKEKAFVGHNWVTDDGGFRNLEALHIGRTDLVIWVTSAYHFPKLRYLELHNCEKLQEVPIELADIVSLQRLELYQTKLAAASANRFNERKHKYIEGRNKKDDREFKLIVFPPYQY